MCHAMQRPSGCSLTVGTVLPVSNLRKAIFIYLNQLVQVITSHVSNFDANLRLTVTKFRVND